MSIQLINNASANDNSEYAKMIRNNLLDLQLELNPVIDTVEQSLDKIVESEAAVESRLSRTRVVKRSAKLAKKRDLDDVEMEYTVRRSARICQINSEKKTENYEEDTNDNDDDVDYDYDNDEESDDSFGQKKRNRHGSLKVKFFPMKNKKFIVDDDEDFVQPRKTKKRRIGTYRRSRREIVTKVDPSDVTPEMLKNVCTSVCFKIKANPKDINEGSTCHQCRQKTLDQKTYCRNPKCLTSRGFFCGVCLHNRYGESVTKALLDPNWTCPPCRGKCNCSLCRDKRRKAPTGQMFKMAVASGYGCVSDMLEKEFGETPELSEEE